MLICEENETLKRVEVNINDLVCPKLTYVVNLLNQ